MAIVCDFVNLILPGEPDNLEVSGPLGKWNISKHYRYDIDSPVLNSKVHSARTYTADHDRFSLSSLNATLHETRHLSLILSYLTSNAVTIANNQASDLTLLQSSDGFPRDRGISGIDPIINETDLSIVTANMLSQFGINAATYHVDVIIHYWLDIISCWSLENLFLGSCTILEIVKQTERRRTGSNLHFYQAINSISSYLGIQLLNRDWINMRNDLIHEGHFSKVNFPSKTKADCIIVCEDVMTWIDSFIHAIFSIPPPSIPRFSRGSLSQLNSYTTWP
jgi:hypothetical protein